MYSKYLTLSIIYLIINCLHVFSQSDSTIYIKKDYLILNNDTINRVDAEGKKQGMWVEYKVFNIYLIPTETNRSDNNDLYKWINDTVIESNNYQISFMGNYVDNKKVGTWYGLNNGNVNKICHFYNGNPTKAFCIYYDNGFPKMLGIQISDLEFDVFKYKLDGCLIEKKLYSVSAIKSLFSPPSYP
jgi:hypothetical protein